MEIRSIGRKPATNKCRRDSVAKFFDWFDINGLTLSVDNYAKWISWLTLSYSPEVARMIRQNVRGLLRFFLHAKLIEINPDPFCPPIKGGPITKHKLIPEWKYKQIRRAAEESGWVWTWAMICGYHTGFRISDVCGLVCGDIKFEGGFACIEKQQRKTGGKVRIPLIPGHELFTWVMKLKPDKKDPMRPMCRQLYDIYQRNPSRLREKLRKIFAKVPGDRHTFQDFRFRFCTDAANSGLSLPVTMEMTGHKTVGSLMKYQVISHSALSEGYKQMRARKKT